ncbi:hypothetical protein FQA39_LY01147 [Lamprigera yunnana]|nr:hypothetical protein FQA39_LY01147 [Lamprigera yunnana]
MKESGKGCKSVDPEVGEMELGEFKELEDCVQAVCGENGILYLGCDDVAASQNCTVLEGNITMPYPHCCSTCKEQHTQ